MNIEQPRFTARPSRFDLDKDVILSKATRLQIDESLANIRFHARIYDEWQFRSVDPTGNSTILNFYGPSGTGKSLAAEAYASALQAPIIHIGIADVESKFMGETATNIQRAFAAASQSGAVLFFDEADTLLGKRLSSVTQGIDNEVNAMRSTLLIELERFEGVAIFATNFAHNYDSAFRGRITHHIHFDLPDAQALRLLWSRLLLPTIPIHGDRNDLIERCTQLSEGLSGRDIRTCMRLALPKALLTELRTGEPAALSLQHVIDAIFQVNAARRHVGSPVVASTNAQSAAALLGIRPPSEEQ